MENIQQLYKVTDGSLLRFGTEPIVCVLETPDMDFNISDDNKAFYRFGLKIDYRVQLGTPLTFILEGSNNRGRRWKRLSTLVIRAGEDEGYSNFRLLGSHARFRLTSADQVPSYNITEYTVKVRMAGNDEALGSQQP